MKKIKTRSIFLGVNLMSLFSLHGIEPIKIVTLGSPNAEVLKTKAEAFQNNKEDLAKAKTIAEQLFASLQPLMPAAGLAAPQIGISKAIFIYTYDRTPEHLEVAINPSFTPVGEETVVGWEGCFSDVLSNGAQELAKIPRYKKIHATYLNLKGETISKELEGFGAKVFQHEYDHLQGIINTERPQATVKVFDNKEELDAFMKRVKEEDAKSYQPPAE